MKHLQDVDFTLQSGERVYFDENGDPAATYELVNWQRNQAGDTVFVAVGSYASLPNGEQFTMNRINITWAAKSPKVSNVCVFHFLCKQSTCSSVLGQDTKPQTVPNAAYVWV